MIFLIEYKRSTGRIIGLREFGDRALAEQVRLAVELDLNRSGRDEEVVLLEAENEEALRRTHPRYFKNLRELKSTA